MSRAIVVSAGIIAAGLWLSALTATWLAVDGQNLGPVLFFFTRPVVTALAATLSIGLLLVHLTRPLVRIALITLGYVRGQGEPGAPATVTPIRARARP